MAKITVIFSTKGGVGKTLIAANLAVSLAKEGKRMDIYRRPSGTEEEKIGKIVKGNPIGANATAQWIRRIGEALDLDPVIVQAVAEEEAESPQGAAVRRGCRGHGLRRRGSGRQLLAPY